MSVTMIHERVRLGSVLLLTALLTACGDSGVGGAGADSGGDSNAPTYTVGGTVTGLKGSGLQVSSGLLTLTISADGAFTFPINLKSGTAFGVTVVAQPKSPAQVCTVTGGSGTVGTSNVTDVAVTCATPADGGGSAPTYSIGGTVNGLVGSGLKIRNGTGDELSVSANGDFTFPTALASGAQYLVTVITQPMAPAQICTVNDGDGTTDTSDVTGIFIACKTTLTLSSSTPASGETGVSRTIAPVLIFSGSLDNSTVTTSSVTLNSASGASQPVTLQVFQDRITVTPMSKLTPLTSYTLTASTAITGGNLEKLAGPASVTFTTGDKAWQTAGPIENNDAAPLTPQIVANASGNAVAVWTQLAGTLTKVWGNYYTPGAGWGTTVPIHTDTTGNASAPTVAIDAQGNALAVWVQTFSNGTRYLEASRYSGGGWSGAGSVETDNIGDASEPQIAFDANGNALVVFTRLGKISAVVRRAGSFSWDREVNIEPGNPATIASRPRIAVNASGNALAVWEESLIDTRAVMSNRYTAGSGWGTATVIGVSPDTAKAPQIGIDAQGNGIAVWYVYDGAVTDILSNRYTAGSGWGTARSITTDKTHEVAPPQIAIDANGNALAIWGQSNGLYTAIWWTRYTGSGWSAAAQIDSPLVATLDSLPQIAVYPNGNAVAVWTRFRSSDGPSNIVSSRYTAGGSWSSVAPIETDNKGDASAPQIAVDANGNASAVWQQNDGTRDNIMSNRFE